MSIKTDVCGPFPHCLSSFPTHALPVLFARKRLCILCVPPKFHNLPSRGNIIAVRGVCCGSARRLLWLCAASRSRMWLRHWSHDVRKEFVCVLVFSSCVSHGNSAIVLRVEMLWDGVFSYMRSDSESFIVSMSRSSDFKSHVDMYTRWYVCHDSFMLYHHGHSFISMASLLHIHPKTLIEIAMVLSTNSGSFPLNSHVSGNFFDFAQIWGILESDKLWEIQCWRVADGKDESW